MGSACSNTIDGDSEHSRGRGSRSPRSRSQGAAGPVSTDGGDSESALAEIRAYHNANHFVDKDEKGNPVIEPLTKKDTIMYSANTRQQVTNYRSPNPPPTQPETASSVVIHAPPEPSTNAGAVKIPRSNSVPTGKVRLVRSGVYTNVLNGPEGEPHRVDSVLVQSIDSNSRNSSIGSPMIRQGSISIDGGIDLGRYASQHTLAPGERSLNDLPSTRDASIAESILLQDMASRKRDSC